MIAWLAAALLLSPPDGLAPALKALQSHQTVAAEFTQVKTSKLFETPQTARGRLLIKRPKQLRWEYRTPYQAVLVVAGDKASMSYPDLGRKQAWDLARDPSLKGVIDSMLFFMASDPAAVTARYEVTVASQDATSTLTLVPRDPKARQLLARIEATVDQTRGVLGAITLVEPDGDTTRLTLSQVVVDRPIDDALLQP